MELIIVIALFSLLFGTAGVVLGNFSTDQALRAGGERLVQSLREAHNNAVTQQRDSAWGVYMDSSTDPDQYVVFKGNSYVSRDTSFDQINKFHTKVIFQNINLTGGGNEIVFSKRSGLTSDFGTVRLATDSGVFDVEVNGMGLIDCK